MKSYRFALQTVLDYRGEQVNLIQQKVAEVEQKRVAILQRIEEYDQAIGAAFLEQQQSLQETVLDITRARNFPGYLWNLRQQRFQEYQKLQEAERHLAVVREQLKQAQLKKRSLEVLKEKDYIKYKQKVEKAEEEFMSEIALNRLRQPHPLNS